MGIGLRGKSKGNCFVSFPDTVERDKITCVVKYMYFDELWVTSLESYMLDCKTVNLFLPYSEGMKHRKLDPLV